MTQLLKKYQDAILIAVAVVFVAAVASLFVWEIRSLAKNLDRAISVEAGPRPTVEFKIDEARALLKARGLIE